MFPQDSSDIVRAASIEFARTQLHHCSHRVTECEALLVQASAMLPEDHPDLEELDDLYDEAFALYENALGKFSFEMRDLYRA